MATGSTPDSPDPATRRSAAGEALGLVQAIVGLLWSTARDPRVPRGTKVIAALLAVYLMCPLDIIPDWIPVLGHLDDAVLIAVAVPWILRRLPPEVVRDHWHGDEPLEALRARFRRKPRRKSDTTNYGGRP